jgi:DNA-binding LytR/AlgR family response regulator
MIFYIESNSNYITIVTKNNKVITRQSLEWAELQLSKKQFIRVRLSYIINLNVLDRINGKSVFINQVEIPVSRTHSAKIGEYIYNGQ